MGKNKSFWFRIQVTLMDLYPILEGKTDRHMYGPGSKHLVLSMYTLSVAIIHFYNHRFQVGFKHKFLPIINQKEEMKKNSLLHNIY